MLHFFRVTLARRERRKRRASRTKIIKRIPFEQHSTGRNIPADKSHTSQCIYKLTIKEISQKKKKKKNERAYVLIPQTFGTRRMGNTDSMQITIPPSPSSKEETFALFPADSHRGGKGGEEGGGGGGRREKNDRGWTRGSEESGRERDDEKRRRGRRGEGMEKRKERKDGANEERWRRAGRRAKTEYLIYEYVWGASSQLEKLTATNGLEHAERSPSSARCPNLESK